MSDIKTIFRGGDDDVTIERVQDVEGILEENKQVYDEDQRLNAFGRRVASIPNIIVEQWLKEGINIFDMNKDPEVQKKVFMKLNSPDWRYLRTHNSRL